MKTIHSLIGLAVCACVPIMAAAQDVAGTVKSVRGDAALERQGQRRPVKAGDSLQAKDRLHTGADSYVALTLTDQSSLSLGPNSNIDLARYAFNATTHQGEQQVKVNSGSLASISGKIAKASPQAVQFNAGTVTLGVRGTQFIIEARPEPAAASVSHWTGGHGQVVRTLDGACWQAGSGAANTRSDCEPDRFILLPDRDGQVGRISLTTPQGEELVQGAYEGAEAGTRTLARVTFTESQVRARYAPVLDSLPPVARSFVLRFAAGSATRLTPESENLLPQLFAAIAQWPVTPDIDVVGHTDTEGDAQTNDTLSLQRARAVAERLTAARLPPERLRVSGRGKRQLLVPTPDNTAEPANRRVEITLY